MIVCELREDIDNSLDILRQCYTRNGTKFSNDDFSLWASDFLDEFEDYEDYQTYLVSEKKRLKDIIDSYNELFKKGMKPSASLHYEETSF